VWRKESSKRTNALENRGDEGARAFRGERDAQVSLFLYKGAAHGIRRRRGFLQALDCQKEVGKSYLREKAPRGCSFESA